MDTKQSSQSEGDRFFWEMLRGAIAFPQHVVFVFREDQDSSIGEDQIIMLRQIGQVEQDLN